MWTDLEGFTDEGTIIWNGFGIANRCTVRLRESENTLERAGNLGQEKVEKPGDVLT